MTTPKIPEPKNKTEAAALRDVLDRYRLTRAEAVHALLNGPEAEAFLTKLNTLIEEGLPAGTTTEGNVVQLPQWFSDVRAQADNDLAALTQVLTPPPPPPAPEGE